MAMATLSLRLSSPCTLGSLVNESPVARHSNLSQLSPPLSKKFSSFTTSSRRRGGGVSMSLQMEQAVAAPVVALDAPTVVEIRIPPESVAGFEADYERVAASWPADLATTLDDHKLEDYVSSAHALVRRWLPVELVSRLERYIHDPQQPPALVIRGLPIDRDLPPTQPEVAKHKVGKYMSETWVVGIARIVGQVFTFGHMIESTGPAALVRQIYTTAEKVDQMSAEGSRKLLDFHVDFFHVKPQCFPHVLVFISLRGPPDREGQTLLCDSRRLYQKLDPADVQLLRRERITWKLGPGAQFSRHLIEGSESHPQINIFLENLPGMKGFDEHVHGSDEVKEAYKRLKQAADTVVDGVSLGTGDVMLLNQRKTLHGRGPYEAKYDGKDRWYQRTYVNSGGFWEAGFSQWPRRVVPMLPDD